MCPNPNSSNMFILLISQAVKTCSDSASDQLMIIIIILTQGGAIIINLNLVEKNEHN